MRECILCGAKLRAHVVTLPSCVRVVCSSPTCRPNGSAPNLNEQIPSLFSKRNFRWRFRLVGPRLLVRQQSCPTIDHLIFLIRDRQPSRKPSIKRHRKTNTNTTATRSRPKISIFSLELPPARPTNQDPFQQYISIFDTLYLLRPLSATQLNCSAAP